MATATAAPQVSYDEWRVRRWRLTGLAFAVLWLVVAVSVGLAGEKRSDLWNLESAIASGSVTEVEIVGLSPDSLLQGEETVFLKWHGTVLSRFAEVTVDNNRVDPRGPGDGARIVGDPAAYLTSLAPGYVRNNAPGFEVTYSELTSSSEWRGWRGPGWAATLGLAAWFGTFLLAGSGPEPWRATRWAWMWLTLLGGPIGCLAYLLLGGPLGLLRPHPGHRRLTGGWALLLSLMFFGGSSAS